MSTIDNPFKGAVGPHGEKVWTTFAGWLEHNSEGLIHELEGPIEPGDIFMWEPTIAAVRDLVMVRTTKTNTDNEMWIEMESVEGKGYWVDEGRFREACVRVPIHHVPEEDR